MVTSCQNGGRSDLHKKILTQSRLSDSAQKSVLYQIDENPASQTVGRLDAGISGSEIQDWINSMS